jgi:peptidoglycan hydrolase-like protein with peptidoglycan-binding domain
VLIHCIMVGGAQARKLDRQNIASILAALEAGSVGQAGSPEVVKAIERLLRIAGYDPGVIDGRFTAKTQEAIKKFQSAIGVTPTGEFDRETTEQVSRVVRAERRHADYNVLGEADHPEQKEKRVLKMERKLDRLGYDVGQIDGVYDQDTARAVAHFKRDQKDVPSTNEKVFGHTAQKVIDKELKGLKHDPWTRRQKEKKERPRLDARTARAAERGMKLGDVGPEVANVKARLKAAGYDPQHMGKHFDERTKGALEAYQRRESLPITGEVDRRTWAHLKRQVIYSDKDGAPPQRMGEKSGAVLRSEKMLKKLGLKPGRVDGFFDRHTQAASRRFERKYHTGDNGAIGSGQIRRMKQEIKRRAIGPSHRVTAYVNGVPSSIRVVNIDGKPVEVRTARAYLRMRRAAKKDGINLQVVSGFRTMAEQQYLYNLYRSGRGNQAAPPGYSNHQSGIALDLNTTGPSDAVGSGPVYNWLARNARRFGFGRIASEHWHWEYHR